MARCSPSGSPRIACASSRSRDCEHRVGGGEPQLLGEEAHAERGEPVDQMQRSGRSRPVRSEDRPVERLQHDRAPARCAAAARSARRRAPRHQRQPPSAPAARLTATSATPSAMWTAGHVGSPRGTRCSGSRRRRPPRSRRRRCRSCGRRRRRAARAGSRPRRASPSITGMPSWTVCGTPANFASSGALEANSRARSCWPAREHVDAEALGVAHDLAACARCCRSRRAAAAARARARRRRWRSCRPGPRAASAVTTVTPVAKLPMTERKWPGSTVLHRTVSVPYMPSSSWLPRMQTSL